MGTNLLGGVHLSLTHPPSEQPRNSDKNRNFAFSLDGIAEKYITWRICSSFELNPNAQVSYIFNRSRRVPPCVRDFPHVFSPDHGIPTLRGLPRSRFSPLFPSAPYAINDHSTRQYAICCRHGALQFCPLQPVPQHI